MIKQGVEISMAGIRTCEAQVQFLSELEVLGYVQRRDFTDYVSRDVIVVHTAKMAGDPRVAAVFADYGVWG